jgi:hypothetical protein
VLLPPEGYRHGEKCLKQRKYLKKNFANSLICRNFAADFLKIVDED